MNRWMAWCGGVTVWVALLPRVVVTFHGDDVITFGWQVRAVWDLTRLTGLGF